VLHSIAVHSPGVAGMGIDLLTPLVRSPYERTSAAGPIVKLDGCSSRAGSR
jgi:hypothetical protein